MKRLFAFFLALCLLFSMLPLTASAATEGTCDDGHHVPGLHFIDKETGYCGNCGIPCHSNGTTVWAIEEDGTMIIYGTGENGAGRLDYYGFLWDDYADQVTSLIVEEGVTGQIFGFSLFENLVSVSLPEGITSIQNGCFGACTSLEQVNFPSTLTELGSNSFQDCAKLKEVYLPAALSSFGARPFGGCTNLTGIWVDEENPNFTNDKFGVLFNKDMTLLEEAPGALSGNYVIPETVTSISWAAFDGCTKLTGVEIPDGVTMLEMELFKNCTSLKTFTIPASVTSMWMDVFRGCTGLETIFFEGDAPAMDGAFNGVTATAYYPAENETWTEDVMQYCGGTITWMAQMSAPSVQVANVASSGKPKLTWDKVEGAKNYKVYRSTDGGVTYSLLITTTGTSLTNTSAAAGTKYYYYVVAVSESGVESGKSNTVYRVCDLPRPTVTVTLNSSGNPKLSWTKIDGATQYKVYRSTDGGATYSLLKTTTGTSLTNTSVTAGTKYYYKVYAVHSNSSANSAYSTVVSIACKLATPAVKVSNVASSGKIKLTWDKVEGASKYNVYRSANGGTTYSLLTTTSGTSLTNTSATAGSKYYYYIVAVSASGVRSEKSNIVYRVCDLPRPVVKVTNVASSGKIKLTWDKIDGAKSYKVYRSTDGGVTYSLLATTSGTSLTNTSTTAGSKYYYKVFAVHSSNSSANSAYSSVVSGVCDLPRPTLTVTLNSAGNPKLSWTKIDGAVKYQVYRSTDGKAWSLLKTTTGTSLTNTSAVSGTTYYYRVLAIAEDSSANSAYSTVKSITAG